ncbi:hypothetical protein [Demequina sp.]|uniref:hypothetical protein n=1 Tax=Demequina sp. TaxID=2050685 RepID=UPI0025C57B0D|nr:hypothetical protein [Demequina sp.]
MGNVVVDQIGPRGELLDDVDTTLSPNEKFDLLVEALPGGTVDTYAGRRVVRFREHLILAAQVTHLGHPWPGFKKRIQIPRPWVDVYQSALADGLTPRFIGIYHYRDVTVFIDFDPSTYVQRKANNSAAHVATNDLFQAQTQGVFARTDRNGNCLTSVRSDLFADYLLGVVREENIYLDVFEGFNAEFLTGARLAAMDAVVEMHAFEWPDAFQGEWAGFFLEYRVDEFLRRTGVDELVGFQKAKRRGDFDYDLVFKERRGVSFFGDLKASNVASSVAPGNDAADLKRCVEQYGRFWYVIYEHETWHSRDEDDGPVIEWNEWRRSMGYVPRKSYDPLSYAGRFKSAVRFARMKILEINEANFHIVLGAFNQGHQPSGADRAVKVMISKTNIDNFLIYSHEAKP